jgi:hypothetical protein
MVGRQIPFSLLTIFEHSTQLSYRSSTHYILDINCTSFSMDFNITDVSRATKVDNIANLQLAVLSVPGHIITHSAGTRANTR